MITLFSARKRERTMKLAIGARMNASGTVATARKINHLETAFDMSASVRNDDGICRIIGDAHGVTRRRC